MTTTNGGSQARIAEHVDGVVQGANDRGVHLQGEAEWRNYSRWADKPAEAPARGASVRLAIDASGFVRSVELLSAALPSTAPTSRDRASGVGHRSAGRPRPSPPPSHHQVRPVEPLARTHSVGQFCGSDLRILIVHARASS